MMRWWMSFYFAGDDHRPLTYPPNKAILGWWCSGYGPSDEAALCILVSANSEDEAKAAIAKDWPEAATVSEWRFCEPRPDGWVPNDRFPPSTWMAERMAGDHP